MHACGMRFLTTYKCLCGEHIRQSCVHFFSDFTNAFTCFHFTVVSSCVFQVVNKNGGRWLPNFTWPGWKQTGNTYSIEYHRTKSPAFGSFWGGVSSLFLLRYLPTSFGMSNASVARVNRYTVCIFFAELYDQFHRFLDLCLDFLVVSWATPRTKSEIHPHIHWWGQHALAEAHFARTNRDESLERVMWCYLFLACCLHCNFGLRYLFPCAPKHPPWLAVALH